MPRCSCTGEALRYSRDGRGSRRDRGRGSSAERDCRGSSKGTGHAVAREEDRRSGVDDTAESPRQGQEAALKRYRSPPCGTGVCTAPRSASGSTPRPSCRRAARWTRSRAACAARCGGRGAPTPPPSTYPRCAVTGWRGGVAVCRRQRSSVGLGGCCTAGAHADHWLLQPLAEAVGVYKRPSAPLLLPANLLIANPPVPH